jgi:hypothetical protein
MKSSKYKYKDIYCISLKPIENATYAEEEETNEWIEDVDDEDDYNV